jgi:hypothetical protein
MGRSSETDSRDPPVAIHPRAKSPASLTRESHPRVNCGLGLEVPSGLGFSLVLKGLGVLARNSFAGRVGGVVDRLILIW